MTGTKVLQIDLTNASHCDHLVKLLNVYMEDEMAVGEPMPGHLAPTLIKRLKKHSGYRGFFALVEDQYVALANCILNVDTCDKKPVLNIHDFIVLPEFRERGIGLLLIDKISDYAASRECTKITLDVRGDNIKAQNLYKKAGFSKVDSPGLFWEKKLRKLNY
jgi:ribosomal protein S18 acetylase RimI-like enzyme